MSSVVNVSIVVYFPNLSVLGDAIASAKESKLTNNVIIVDNGLEDRIKSFSQEMGCEYIRPTKNLGFGSAHNLALRKYGAGSKYFLILNPDVKIHHGCIESLVALMDSRPDVVLSAPKVLNPDGTLQRVHKRLPSFMILFGRRFLPGGLRKLWAQELDLYELQDCDLDKPYYLPSISGCFMFFRSKSLLELGGFDERFFMYIEDVDLSRRASMKGSVVYWPQAVITHLWARGSHRNWRLTLMHITSVLKYFLKWGFSSKSDVRPFG
jgi:GT2 family glycosyltransferase